MKVPCEFLDAQKVNPVLGHRALNLHDRGISQAFHVPRSDPQRGRELPGVCAAVACIGSVRSENDGKGDAFET